MEEAARLRFLERGRTTGQSGNDRPPSVVVRDRRRQGFTLLELLLALGAMAIVAGGLAGALRGGFNAWKRLESELEGRQLARAVFNQLANELRNAIPFPKESLVGSAGEIRFFTAREIFTEDVPVPAQGIFEIIYRFKDGGDGASPLQKTEVPLGAAGAVLGSAPRASELPAEVRFEYPYLPEKQGDPPLWRDQWINPGVLPAALRVRLSLRDDVKEARTYERVIVLPPGELTAWRD